MAELVRLSNCCNAPSVRNIDVEKVFLRKMLIECTFDRVTRGTVNYFGASFATVKTQFDKLDRWLRTRIRCMKYKRIWKTDRRRLRNQAHCADRAPGMP